MSESQPMSARPDVDILEDIENLIVHYPPLVNDRHHVQVSIADGAATLSGHVKTPITRLYFVDGVTVVDGVKNVDARHLYVDETIRLEVGRVVPVGLWANVEYGTVILTGKLPDGATEDGVVNSLRGVAGVRRVITSFK